MNVMLCLLIGKAVYKVEPLSPNPVGNPAWRLTKMKTGKSYEIIWRFNRAECNCPDFVWRRDSLGEACKHCAAMFQVGLLPKEKVTA